RDRRIYFSHARLRASEAQKLRLRVRQRERLLSIDEGCSSRSIVECHLLFLALPVHVCCLRLSSGCRSPPRPLLNLLGSLPTSARRVTWVLPAVPLRQTESGRLKAPAGTSGARQMRSTFCITPSRAGITWSSVLTTSRTRTRTQRSASC